MAQDGSSQLTNVCFLASFLWLSHSLQRHSLIDQPRLSAFLLLSISGAAAFVASLFSKWLPGTDGRFDSEAALKGSQSFLPQRPRRFYVPCIIVLVVVRLEALHRVSYDFQCSAEGVEAFLPLLLAAYRFFTHRAVFVASDEPEDMWGSPLEDFKSWLMSSPIVLLFSTLLLSYGVFLLGDFTQGSTYFCSTLADQSSYIVFLQWLGVFIDAVVIVMAWRVLSWARTTKSRLRTLSAVLLATSLAASVPWTVARLFNHRQIIGHHPFRGIGSLYVFDVLGTGLIIATLIISGALLTHDTTPLEPVAIVTFVSGALTSIHNILSIGTYKQTSVFKPLAVLAIISTGFTIFMYASNLRSVLFVRRAFIVFLIVWMIGSSTLYAYLQKTYLRRHPVDDLIYNGRVEADRWLRHASVSTTLKLAVAEYKERHHGRDPPPNFDKWFEFAQQRKSPIIDKFDRIEKDILPFWGMKQQKIRDGLEILKDRPGVGIVKIVDGEASHNHPSDPSQKLILDEAVSMISKFAQHLPDISIAINLEERPRVLVPWDDLYKFKMAAIRPDFQLFPSRLQSRQAGNSVAMDNINGPLKIQAESSAQPYVPAKEFRQLQTLACPPGSPSRSGVHWNVRDFCHSCVLPHSQGHFLQDWPMSLDPCHQADIFNLHDFFTTPHRLELYQDLLPLFSRSKTESFNDILIPLVRPDVTVEPNDLDFAQKPTTVFWQGSAQGLETITSQALHGGHRHRLVHLANNASVVDKVSMLLGIGAGSDSRFRYEDTKVRDANGPLPFQFSFTSIDECEDANCQLIQHEFGLQPPAQALDNRYVMLLDSADGPPVGLVTTLLSNSVPVLSTIFQEWYTERIMAWVHFIPIDLRFHALHSTMAYFTGLKDRGKLNGREQLTEGRREDAKWISEQGRKWARKALRREDMEVYMFRLLLEWARVVDDERDKLGFVMS
ncbi:hypothetical protein F4809DRAFT_196708 [Biscogniauxia mediterranea]|nr:hypothetical protein F4809DRAFT_196708 [Biscogniauxia mediterranea]